MQKKQLTIISVVIVALIVLAGGAYAYTSQSRNDQQHSSGTSSDTKTEDEHNHTHEPSKTTEIASTEGVITGSLTYPSEGIPSDLVVHAYNIDTKKDYFVKDHLSGSQFKYGKGYKITVPTGKYYVYGMLESQPDQRAYYDEFIKCGADTNKCTDMSRITVTVEPGAESEDAIVGDWYNPCVVEGGEQPTTKFDLPTC